MDYTVMQNAATKIVDNFKSVGNDINNLKDNVTGLKDNLTPRMTTAESDIAAIDDDLTSIEEASAYICNCLSGALDPEDPNSGYAELADIRVGYDDTTYPNAGTAVRSQISELHEEIDIITNNLINLENLEELQINTIVEVGTINGSTGEPSYANNRLRSADYIDVSAIETLSISITTGYKYAVHSYGENHVHLSDTGWQTTNNVMNDLGDTKYIKLVIANVDDTVIQVAEVNCISLKSSITIVSEVISLKEQMSSVMETLGMKGSPVNVVFEVNTINGNTGETSPATNRLASVGYIELRTTGTLSFSIANGYKYGIHKYDSSYNHIYDADWQAWTTENKTMTDFGSAKYLRIAVANTSDTTIQVAEANCISVMWNSSGTDADPINPTIESDKIYEFAEMYKDKANIDTYLYFTDMHTCNRGGLSFANKHETYLDFLENVSNALPLSFVMCGGDWINNNDTKAEFCFKFGNLSKQCHKRFNKFYPVLGNHDTNYQGISETGAESNTGTIPYDVLENLFMSDLYYQFNTNNASYYVFNTGLDWTAGSELDDYMKTQVEWFADKLLADDAQNIVISGHMLYVEKTDSSIANISQTIMNIAQALNNRSTFSFNGKSYEYSNSTGKVKYAIFGHSHEDYVGSVNDIPVVLCKDGTNYGASTIPDCDLIMSDFDSNILHLVRIGNGENRTVNMAN